MLCVYQRYLSPSLSVYSEICLYALKCASLLEANNKNCLHQKWQSIPRNINVCVWLTHKKLCRNAQFGDLTKNRTYNYTSAILTSVIPKICLSHFQSSMNQHGICEMKPPKKQTGLGVWWTSFLCSVLLCFQAWRVIYPHMVETNRKVVNYCAVVCLVWRFCSWKINHQRTRYVFITKVLWRNNAAQCKKYKLHL